MVKNFSKNLDGSPTIMKVWKSTVARVVNKTRGKTLSEKDKRSLKEEHGNSNCKCKSRNRGRRLLDEQQYTFLSIENSQPYNQEHANDFVDCN